MSSFAEAVVGVAWRVRGVFPPLSRCAEFLGGRIGAAVRFALGTEEGFAGAVKEGMVAEVGDRGLWFR